MLHTSNLNPEAVARQVAEFIIALNLEATLSYKAAPIEVEAKTLSDTSRPSVSKKAEVGRNDPCPCGSGKKFKKCGMLNTEEHQHSTQLGN